MNWFVILFSNDCYAYACFNTEEQVKQYAKKEFKNYSVKEIIRFEDLERNFLFGKQLATKEWE